MQSNRIITSEAAIVVDIKVKNIFKKQSQFAALWKT
jgi:hypothetical protein